ncbi:MAG: hypothetical protein WEC73_00515 [Chthoniobacterales bacterium]
MKLPRVLLILVVALAGLATAGYFAARHFLPPLLASWVAGPDFNRLLAQSVGHALKVDGQFSGIELKPELTVATAGFTSTGWPGQAIGALNAGATTGRFDPWAILRGKWQVDLINIASAEFKLVAPDNARKTQDPVMPPKPWYAFLMPSQFFCPWIECPDMTIELPIGQTPVRGTGLHLGATMIGKNFKYFGKNGTFHYPGYTDLAVDAFEVYVTRELIDIGYLYLREPASPRSNLFLQARLGQHADKSIDARARIMSLDLAPLLPADVATILSGQLEGELSYRVGSSGDHATGQGSLALRNAVLQDWEYLDNLARRSGDSSFRTFTAEQASFDYTLADDVFRVTNLNIRGRDAINIRGEGTWEMTTSAATATITADRIPLGAYLPASLTGSLRGDIGGEASWSWQGTDLGNGRGGGTIALAGAELSGFRFQDFLDRFLKTTAYADIRITQASATWKQDNNGLHLENINVLAPGQAGLRGSVTIDPDGSLRGTVLAGLPAASLKWLPDATTTVFGRTDDGLHWCSIELSGTAEKPRNNFAAQALRQLERHPLALAELALRGLSWWLGDHLRTTREG